MDGWSLDDDKDVLMVDDLDTSLQNLSNDLLVGRASYGDLCHFTLMFEYHYFDTK